MSGRRKRKEKKRKENLGMMEVESIVDEEGEDDRGDGEVESV